MNHLDQEPLDFESAKSLLRQAREALAASDALKLSHIRDAYYRWRSGDMTLQEFHRVIEKACYPSSLPQEGQGK